MLDKILTTLRCPPIICYLAVANIVAIVVLLPCCWLVQPVKGIVCYSVIPNAAITARLLQM
jgi:hypothetical protein